MMRISACAGRGVTPANPFHRSFVEVDGRMRSLLPASWLDAFDEAPIVSDEVLEALEMDQKADLPPEDKWSC
jgi:hypothetical protein